MSLKFFWSIVIVSIFASANGSKICGSSDPPSEAIKATQILQSSQHAERANELSVRLTRQNKTLVIPTYLHVIEAEDDAGFVTDTMIHDQMHVLNETFAPHSIQFLLKNVSYTVNDTWASSTRNIEKSLALRRGGYDDLNIFFESKVGTTPGMVTGLCEFPVDDPLNTGINDTSWSVLDGCHVGAATMPGGPGVPADPEDNQGKTATHEVGHWFGLFHVFEGFDCNGEGDFIDDTPAMLTASEGCHLGQDTCPDQPGLDPIHNYMDYSSNPCQHEFTLGQEYRMHQSFDELRKPKN